MAARSKRALSKSKASEKVKCTFCTESFEEKDPALRCDICLAWVCLSCTKMTRLLYTELVKNDDADVDWSCRVCKNTKSDLRSINATLIELKKSSESRLTGVKDRLEKLETTVHDTVKTEVEAAKEELAETLNKNIIDNMDKIIDSRLREISDRRNRSQNLLLFNVPTLESEKPLDRKDHDINAVKHILRSICPDKGELDVKTCFRLTNKKKPNPGIPPVKVVIVSKEQRRAFLLNSKCVPEIDDGTMKNVIVVRDLTVEQRKEQKQYNEEKKKSTHGARSQSSSHDSTETSSIPGSQNF